MRSLTLVGSSRLRALPGVLGTLRLSARTETQLRIARQRTIMLTPRQPVTAGMSDTSANFASVSTVAVRRASPPATATAALPRSLYSQRFAIRWRSRLSVARVDSTPPAAAQASRGGCSHPRSPPTDRRELCPALTLPWHCRQYSELNSCRDVAIAEGDVGTSRRRATMATNANRHFALQHLAWPCPTHRQKAAA